MTCPCTVEIAAHFSEPGLVAMIQAYAAEPPHDIDIIKRLLSYATGCEDEFGFSFRYSLRSSQLLLSTWVCSHSLCEITPNAFGDALMRDDVRFHVNMFHVGRSKVGDAIRTKCNAFIDTISKDLREFSTPRCRHVAIDDH